MTALVYAGLPETRERDRDRRVRDELRAYGARFGGSLRDRNLLVLILGGFAIFVVRNGVLTSYLVHVSQRSTRFR